MTAALPMGGQKITGMADPTVATDGATKNYVDTTTAAFFGTGDIKLTLKTVADSGWLLFDDGTFGNAGSGSSNSNSINNLALFTLLFNNLTDAAAPILTSGGGATTRAAQTNAATAWAALCRMSLPKTLGRALAVAGTGSGLTARALGSSLGAETTTLAANNIPTITSTNAAQSITVTPSGGSAQVATTSTNWAGTTTQSTSITGIAFTAGSVGSTNSFSGNNSISTTYTNSGIVAVPIMQPTSFLNAMVKI